MKNEVCYYYLRDEKNNPIGCVAIQNAGNGKINRGVSICSKRDRWDRKCARGLALSRLNEAKRSLFSREFGMYHGTKACMPVTEFNCKFEAMVAPTEKESKILD